MFNMNIYPVNKLKSLRNNDFIINFQRKQAFHRQEDLFFDSRFESGNLSYVSYDKSQDLYCLLLHNDVNTSGYTNWFYFSARCRTKGVKKFAIMNYAKAGWPFNQGLGICNRK